MRNLQVWWLWCEGFTRDMAHTLHRLWRSAQDLQHIATGGKAGKEAGTDKPFNNLRVAVLQEELRARGVYVSGKKEDMQAKLDGLLCGVQHVPTLLSLGPQQPLPLDQYIVLDCEPLQDLKGHFSHLLDEFPFWLSGGDQQYNDRCHVQGVHDRGTSPSPEAGICIKGTCHARGNSRSDVSAAVHG